MKIHPVAELFPMLAKPELQELADDIKANGLQQPIVMQADVLLDGRNRMAACKLVGVSPKFTEYRGESPVAFIVGVNLKRRHLATGQKVAVGLEIAPYLAKESKERQRQHGGTAPGRTSLTNKSVVSVDRNDRTTMAVAAKTVGVSVGTLTAAKNIKERSPEKFERIKQNTLTVARAKKELKAEDDKAALVVAQKNITDERRKKLESVCDLRACSCADLFKSGIKPDAVITDPPYPKEFLKVFSELAEGCAKAKVPLVAVMSGQSYLPDVMQRLCEHLEYRWMLAYLTPGGQAVQQWQAKVNTAWKPVILFGKAGEWFGDVAVSKTNDNDKRFHGWGQSESGMADLVERLTKPGQLICDPFLGGGTTAVVSLGLGRKFVGCDIDKGCVEKTRQRVEAETCSK